MAGYLSNYGRKQHYLIKNGRKIPISGMDFYLLTHPGAGSPSQALNPAVQAVLNKSRGKAWGRISTTSRPLNRSTSTSRTSTATKAKASWKKAYEQAKAANKRREQELRRKYQQRYSAVMKTLQGLGAQERKNILERGSRREGEAQQSAIERGLSMGTIADSLKRSVQEATDRNLGNLEDMLRRTKLGYESGLRKDELDFIERITDKYPDQRLYAQAFRQYGQGQGALGTSNLPSASGLQGFSYGTSHSFYRGRDPITGGILTSPYPNWPSHHYFSNQKAKEAERRAASRQRKQQQSLYQDLLNMIAQGRQPKNVPSSTMPRLNYSAPNPFTGYSNAPMKRSGTYSSAMPDYLKQRYGF